MSRDGLGPKIIPKFEKLCKCHVKLLPCGDGGQLVSRIQLDAERGKPTAHIVLGIDQLLFERMKPWVESWGEWIPKGLDHVPSELKLIPYFLPFDYGALAWIANTEEAKDLGEKKFISLLELLDNRWKRNLILEDPRTSSPGLFFLLFTQMSLKDSMISFWKSLRSQWLTLPPGWDQAYGLFLKGEAPLVWSYVTSQAYHDEHPEKVNFPSRYRAVLFQEGQPVQIEGAAMIRGSFESLKQREIAMQFLEYLLNEDVQSAIPNSNWMNPVRRDVHLPNSFKKLPKPKRLLPIYQSHFEIENTLNQWSEAIEP